MIKISKDLLSEINEHGKRTYPEECCGFLLGVANERQKLVHEVQASSNALMVERQRRFLITPDEYRRTEVASRAKSLEVIGFYHSHPDYEARPSAFDLEHAWPWFSYVIVSVEQGEPTETTSWVIDDERRNFSEEKLFIIE